MITYVRLVQRTGAEGATTTASSETRVWRRQDGNWRCVHFHRTKLATV